MTSPGMLFVFGVVVGHLVVEPLAARLILSIRSDADEAT
jgi:hypothetical protein